MGGGGGGGATFIYLCSQTAKNRFQEKLFRHIIFAAHGKVSYIRAIPDHENICCRRKPESTLTFMRINFHTRLSRIRTTTVSVLFPVFSLGRVSHMLFNRHAELTGKYND